MFKVSGGEIVTSIIAELGNARKSLGEVWRPSNLQPSKVADALEGL